jgi:hypothetical protein
MATFIGTGVSETITPAFVSAGTCRKVFPRTICKEVALCRT